MKRIYTRGAERRELELDASLPPAIAKWRFDRTCAQLDAHGWQRVAGDEPRPPSHDELVAAIRAAPDELDTYLVYADWLAERGDPWGELITVQHALATLPADAAYERRRELERLETKLRFVHAARLWGELGTTIEHEHTQTYACELVRATWQCGFLRAIELHERPDRGAWLLDTIAGLDVAIVLRSIELSYHDAPPTEAVSAVTRNAWPAVERVSIVLGARDAAFDADALCFAIASGRCMPRLHTLELFHARLQDEAIPALRAAGFTLADRPGASGVVLTRP